MVIENTGEFTPLKLIEDLGTMYPNESSKKTIRFGIYECNFCGTHFKTRTSDVNNGHTKSCGCRSLINSSATHGGSGTKLYNIWRSIKARTSNEKLKAYTEYGGRGITMCDKWYNDFVSFRDWSLENGYVEDTCLSIDRIDNDGIYEPSNCRWTTKTIQSRNTRIPKNNTSGYKGVYFDKSRNNYSSNIYVDKKHITIGRYKTAIEAGLAYNNYITLNELEGFTLNNIPYDYKG